MADPHETYAGEEEREAEPIPLSALQHAVYCLRQAALIHLERMWAENLFTAEGRVLHVNVDKPNSRSGRSVRRVNGLPLASKRLNLTGIADLVEFRPGNFGEIAHPVEFKRGKPKLHRADEVQLCAQALCLEEMLGTTVSEGSLYYGQTRRRVVVPFDTELRALTEETAIALRRIFISGTTPPPTTHKVRCRVCSLLELCRPQAVSKRAKAWRASMIEMLITEAP